MFNPAILTIGLLTITLIFFIWGKYRYDVIALMSLFVAVLIGVVPFHNVFNGFSQPAVTTVACIMMLSGAIAESGLIENLAASSLQFTHSFRLKIAVLCFITLILSAFMNNIGALSLMMPFVISVTRKYGRNVSETLLPLAVCAGLGGITTLIGTPPNIIISQYRLENIHEGFSFFSFSTVGGPIALIGFIFIFLCGKYLVPKERSGQSLEQTFDLDNYIAEVIFTDSSPFIGKSIRELEHETQGNIIVVGLIRNKHKRFNPRQSEKIRPNDIFIIEACPDEMKKFIVDSKASIKLNDTNPATRLTSEDNHLMEAIVTPNSKLEGVSSKQYNLRSRFNLTLLGISRHGKNIRQRIHQTKLKTGDVLLLQSSHENISDTIIQMGLLPLKERNISLPEKKQQILPPLFFLLAIVIASIGLAPAEICFAGAIVLGLITRSISARKLYDYINWSLIVLLAALIPVGNALQSSGATDMISQALYQSTHASPPLLTIALTMLITIILSSVINNAATAIIMAPIALTLANSMGLSPDVMLMAVAIGASCSFLTPIAHQNNVIIMGPGGYQFSDFIKFGLPLTILIIIISCPLLLWAWQ